MLVTVSDVLLDANARPVVGRQVAVELVAGPLGAFLVNGEHLITSAHAITDASGAWSVDLTPNGQIDPAGTYYLAHVGVEDALPFVVPDGVGAVVLRSVLIDDPTLPNPVTTGVQLPQLEAAVAAAVAELGMASGPSGQPRWSGLGPPPDVIVGSSPGDVYLDYTTGDLYRLE